MGGRVIGQSLSDNCVGREGEEVALSKLLALMLSFSDNFASLCVQNLVGGGSAVNAWLVERGFAETRVNSRTRGREAERERWGWGQTTAREMAEL